jgi:hypothetical protein
MTDEAPCGACSGEINPAIATWEVGRDGEDVVVAFPVSLHDLVGNNWQHMSDFQYEGPSFETRRTPVHECNPSSPEQHEVSETAYSGAGQLPGPSQAGAGGGFRAARQLKQTVGPASVCRSSSALRDLIVSQSQGLGGLHRAGVQRMYASRLGRKSLLRSAWSGGPESPGPAT